ncbi:MAG: flagellar hook-basal body protein [Armatimonadetes bacterium]|nr:flagellar hook-basal body protein [Armatimonadota bacterium]
MQRGVYAAATAMATAQEWMDVVANNLANASTTGFKRDGVAFNDGLLRSMSADGGNGNPIGTLGAGSVIKEFFSDFTPGAMIATGNALDLAIKAPNAAFAVQTPDGVRYTRDGSFQINAQRQLVDKMGQPVLNRELQPITIPNSGVLQFDDTGNLSLAGKKVDRVAVFSGTFRKEQHNQFTGSNTELIDDPVLETASLESSNVNAVEEMIAMIRLNRAFELAQKTVQNQDESNDRLISSLQGR